MAERGQIQLRPVRTAEDVRRQWLQQVVQLALPDLTPLRRNLIVNTLASTGIQEWVAAAIQGSGLGDALRETSELAAFPVMEQFRNTVEALLRDQLAPLTALIQPALTAAATGRA